MYTFGSASVLIWPTVTGLSIPPLPPLKEIPLGGFLCLFLNLWFHLAATTLRFSPDDILCRRGHKCHFAALHFNTDLAYSLET